jgi:F-type H+-transporting ATPase subunit delta
VILDPVTTRWAKALFGLAKRKAALEAVRDDVRRLGGEFASERVRQWLLTSSDNADMRRTRLKPVTESFHELTRNFVDLILDRRRDEVLISLHAAFEKCWQDAEGIEEGVVETARDLDEAELAKLASAIGARIGKTVRLKAERNEELVGGVRVRIGARMLDHTVQGRLEGLRRRLLETSITLS